MYMTGTWSTAGQSISKKPVRSQGESFRSTLGWGSSQNFNSYHTIGMLRRKKKKAPSLSHWPNSTLQEHVRNLHKILWNTVCSVSTLNFPPDTFSALSAHEALTRLLCLPKGNFPVGLTRTLISVSWALINSINKIQVKHYFNLKIQLKYHIIFLGFGTPRNIHA